MDEVKLAETLSDHKHRIGSLEHRMDKSEKIIDEIRNIATSVQLLAQESKATGEKVDNLTEKVETIEAKPGKDWSSIKVAVVTSAITLIVSMILTAAINNLF